MTRTIEGYVTEWDGADQIGVYEDRCGGDDGNDPIDSYVTIGENANADDDERWAVIDQDADGEGQGIVSRHPTREAAEQAAHDHIARRVAR